MPYSIIHYDTTALASIADGTIDQSTSLKLIGKNYAGYGEIQNENFLYLLENFAGTTEPTRPTKGQIWYDSGAKKLKFYDNNGNWRTTGGAEIGPTEPTGLTVGDFWFNTATKQLFSWNGLDFTLIGPQGVAGLGTTEVRSRIVLDDSSAQHAIIEGLANDQTIFVVAKETFNLKGDANNSIDGFTGQPIRRGITMAYTETSTISTVDYGVTSDYRFYGTASTADALAVDGVPIPSSEFVQKSGEQIFNSLVRFPDLGFTVGTTPRFKISIESGTYPVIENFLSDTIKFRTHTGGAPVNPINIVGYDVLPGGSSGVSNNIGSSGAKFATVYATSFNGTATQADTLKVDSNYRTGKVSSDANTVAVRDGTGKLYATLFDGTASSARYADLAEIYATDRDYEVGTVVAVGGEKEVTACTFSDHAIGVISEKPAYLMNSEAEGQPIALKGRVPVRVSGVVVKGQRLVAGAAGTAIVSLTPSPSVFAIALESSDELGIKLVEAIIL
jgi:hypothetical protein